MRQKPRGRPGHALPYARMERAVEYRMLGYKWGDIERIVGIPHSTLMRWYSLPDWKAMEADWQAQDPLVRRAKAVLAKALAVELAKRVPNTALAERILAPHGNGGEGGEASYLAHPGVVLLPMKDKGLESRPPTQVLMQPAPEMPAPPAVEPKPKRRPPGPKGKRRVAGPDE